ncbi:hypothetical protein ACFLRC_02060 [Candidatus Altiarchaeota archaeon]
MEVVKTPAQRRETGGGLGGPMELPKQTFQPIQARIPTTELNAIALRSL